MFYSNKKSKDNICNARPPKWKPSGKNLYDESPLSPLKISNQYT